MVCVSPVSRTAGIGPLAVFHSIVLARTGVGGVLFLRDMDVSSFCATGAVCSRRQPRSSMNFISVSGARP